MGHYIWVIKCKRWEYSSEPGAPKEPLNIQFNDDEEYGRESGGANPEELVQPYEQSNDKTAECIIDENATDRSEIYGYYGGLKEL